MASRGGRGGSVVGSAAAVPEWMTVAEACRYLKVSRSTLFRYMKDGRLPSSQVPGGRGRRIKHEDLDRLLEGEAKDRRQNYGESTGRHRHRRPTMRQGD